VLSWHQLPINWKETWQLLHARLVQLYLELLEPADDVAAYASLQHCLCMSTGCALRAALQACDCKAGLPKVSGLNVSLDVSLPFISKVPDKTVALLTNLFKVGAVNASSVDAVAQWVAASAVKMPLPKIVINATGLSEPVLLRCLVWVGSVASCSTLSISFYGLEHCCP
jgi:hypothetical protein